MRCFVSLLCCLVFGLGGCVADGRASMAASVVPSSLAILPGTPAPAHAGWFENRLDHGPAVTAGFDGPRFTQSVTRTRGGFRVSVDGRVRDTLRVHTTTESFSTGVR